MLIPIHPVPVKILAVNMEFKYLSPVSFISPVTIESTTYLKDHEVWLIQMTSGARYTISIEEYDALFSGIMPPPPVKETEH